MLILFLTSTDEVCTTPDAAALDAYLVGIARGDAAALTELYQCTKTDVYSFALSILKDPHDAEDVLHDCYLRVWSAAADYRSAGKPMAWLLTITRNLCLQRLRARRKTADVPPEEWERLWESRPALSAEDRLLLGDCMQRLSDEERQIVVLHAVSGFKHQEIAHLLSLPLPTVLSKYHRALKKLKTHFMKGEALS